MAHLTSTLVPGNSDAMHGRFYRRG